MVNVRKGISIIAIQKIKQQMTGIKNAILHSENDTKHSTSALNNRVN